MNTKQTQTSEQHEDDRPLLIQRALHGRGLMRFRVGRYGDAVSDLAAARLLAESRGRIDDLADLLLDEAMALDWNEDWRQSAASVERARTLKVETRSVLAEARLLTAEGRTAMRLGDWKTARRILANAVDLLGPFEDEGYETLVIALLMLGAIAPSQGDLDYAAVVFERLLSLCQTRGDKLHLAATFNNRRNLWIAKNDFDRALADLRRYLELAVELGMVSMRYYGEYNTAELNYQHGNFADAEIHADRADAVEQRLLGDSRRRLCLLLKTRILTVQGRLEEARVVYERIKESQDKARRDGRAEALFVPSEEVLFSMIDLSTRLADESEWNALLSRSEHASVDQEPIEVVEFRGLAAWRRNDVVAAEYWLRKALAVSQSIPTIMVDRLRGHLARLDEETKRR